MSDSGDHLSDFYDEGVDKQLFTYLKQIQNRKMKHLDKMLLKGVYTNDRDELGFHRMFNETTNKLEFHEDKQEQQTS